MIDISILAVSQNDAPYLPKWLAHLERQIFPSARFEVILADLNSRDETWTVLQQYKQGAPMRIREAGRSFTKANEALNACIHLARGQYLFFLSTHLLASPHLLERHYAMHQEHADTPRGVVGGIQTHPKMPAEILTRWFLPEELPTLSPATDIDYIDWGFANFSLPRESLEAVGGFEKDVLFAEFGEVELAHRLHNHGLQSHYHPDAWGYSWHPVTLIEERCRWYERGYSLHHILHQTASRTLQRRYLPLFTPARVFMEKQIVPYYLSACAEEPENTHRFGRFYRRIFRYELHRGYIDAQRGRPPLFTPMHTKRQG